ncbi:MAG: proline dehydrogenase family protein [Prolixibacteraceae bacterium]|nr:proline dehydrogenase family protein [Prolixibacteraceae bacterium]
MFNKVIAGTLPYVPKKFVWVFSKRYVAGENIESALTASKVLNQSNISVTVDLLGEFIKTIEEAELNKNQYIEIVKRFTNEGINGSFSVKPTSFGLLIDKEKCYEYIREVVAEASKSNSFVRIDMEDATCTDLEIELYGKLKSEFSLNTGLVLQAYLKRTFSDIENMIEKWHSPQTPINFRLCKGIYIEPANIAFKDYHEVRHHFLTDLDLMLKNGIYVGIATHDSFLVREAIALIEKHKVPKNKYEFQMLYGVTPGLRDSIVSQGHNMRIYVPFGKDWFGYCSRRLKENPKMVTDIMKALFIRG